MPGLLRMGEGKRGVRVGFPQDGVSSPLQTPSGVGQGSRKDGEGERGGRRSTLRASRDEEMSRSTYPRKSKVFSCTGDFGVAAGDGAEKVGRDLSVGGHLPPPVLMRTEGTGRGLTHAEDLRGRTEMSSRAQSSVRGQGTDSRW